MAQESNKVNYKDFICDTEVHVDRSNTIIPERINRKPMAPTKELTNVESWERFNDDWWLSDTGDMWNDQGHYGIYDNRLNEGDWMLHLMGKVWFDANTFLPAYFEACNRAGIKEVTITIRY